MNRGDIVLILFPFTDLTGNKLRPAVIIANNGADIIVCFITSQLKWQEDTDVVLNPNPVNNLKKPSLIRTNKIATLDKSLAKGLLGKLTAIESHILNNNLKILLKLT